MSNATQRNFGALQRERQRRIGRSLEGEMPIGSLAVTGDPGWDAFFGALHDKEDAANAEGMGFRANLADVGRFDEPTQGGGRLTATDRAGIAGNVALANYADQSGAQGMARDAYRSQRLGQIADELQQSDDERAVNEAYADPNASRASILQRLPAQFRENQRAQWAAQDAAATKAQADQLRAQTEAAKANTEAVKARAAEASASPFAARVDATGKPLTGAAALEGLPESVRATVQAVLEGRQALPTGTATKDPYWKGVIQLANQADPTFDAVNYNARASTRKDFTSGAASKQINAINTVVGHLHDLAGKGEKLDNYGMNWLNSVRNALTPGGSERGVAINDFETLKEGVATELMRTWRQVGAGSEKEIEDWKAQISSAKSPQELRGAFKTIGGMLESKLDALDSQYKQGMGTDDVSAITPESRGKLDALQGVESRARSADSKFSAPVEGAMKGIPGVEGGLAKFTNGKWIRVQ